MNDDQLERYCRQMIVSGFDIEGQELLSNSTVLIIGLGGLGCPAAQYLASSGVGNLILADYDTIELSNLPRQTLYTKNDINKSKAEIAKQRLLISNPNIQIQSITQKLDKKTLQPYIDKADIVLDCTDSFDSRFAANQSCLLAKTPLVFGAAIRMQGQVAVFDFRYEESSCLGCLYDKNSCNEDSCLYSGIIGPITGIIGSMMALAAMQLIVGNYNLQAFNSKLLLFDAKNWSWNKVTLTKNQYCNECSGIVHNLEKTTS
jgi:adenylyltransferase/sulfurtransferase